MNSFYFLVKRTCSHGFQTPRPHGTLRSSRSSRSPRTMLSKEAQSRRGQLRRTGFPQGLGENRLEQGQPEKPPSMDIVSDIPSGSIYGIYIYIYRYVIWHSIWQSFWHRLWHSIWHSLASYLAYMPTFFLAFYLASILTVFLASILWF